MLTALWAWPCYAREVRGNRQPGLAVVTRELDHVGGHGGRGIVTQQERRRTLC
jgi:hypothetical protein